MLEKSIHVVCKVNHRLLVARVKIEPRLRETNTFGGLYGGHV